MIDIHNHLIPCIDDGSDSLELSRELLLGAIDEGISDVLITPHFMKTGPYNVEKEELLKRFAKFKEDTSDLDINLYLGNELLIDYELDELLMKDKVCTMNDSRYVLVEFSFGYYDSNYDEYLYNISISHEIIIAHPERYFFVQKDYDFVDRWLSAGYYLQSNSTSLLHGETRKIIYHLIEKGKLSFIASDAHNRHRPLSLANAYDRISRRFSKETADLLMNENPLRVIRDKKIKTVPPIRKKLF